MRSLEELQKDVDQFDFRIICKTRVRKNPDDSLSIEHAPPDRSRQFTETVRFKNFAEKNWTIREIDFAAGFHPTGEFRPHEDAEARITRTKIANTKDECLVENREPTVIGCFGFRFATWEEAKAFDGALRQLQREALMLLGACAALELHGADFRLGVIKNNIDCKNDSAFDATIAQLRHEVAAAVKARA